MFQEPRLSLQRAGSAELRHRLSSLSLLFPFCWVTLAAEKRFDLGRDLNGALGRFKHSGPRLLRWYAEEPAAFEAR